MGHSFFVMGAGFKLPLIHIKEWHSDNWLIYINL